MSDKWLQLDRDELARNLDDLARAARALASAVNELGMMQHIQVEWDALEAVLARIDGAGGGDAASD